MEQFAPPQPSAGTEKHGYEGHRSRTTPIRKLFVTEALVQKYGPIWGCKRCHWSNAAHKSHDAAQEKPETHVTPFAMDTEMQLPATGKRAAGTVVDGDMEDGNKENKRARTMGGMEVCVLDGKHDEWPDDRRLGGQ